jgi:uridine phosphorylase
MLPETLPITGLPSGKIPASVLVCGDPARATTIADEFDDFEQLSEKREYRSYVGTYDNIPVAVCSHGIGSPGAAIAFEELISAGARRLIRVGTCGGLQENILSGHLVLATAAVQNIGYAREVVPQGFPAAADIDISQALKQAAAGFKGPWSSGFVLTSDSFYQGVDLFAKPNYRQMARAHVLAVEMECAALFIVSSLRGVKAGAILTVDGNVLESNGVSMESYDPDNNVVYEAIISATRIALEAFVLLSNGSD